MDNVKQVQKNSEKSSENSGEKSSEKSSELILGIDPGSQHTGYGLIEKRGAQLRTIEFGCWSPSANLSFAQKLNFIGTRMDQVLSTYRPEVVGIEQIFLGESVASAFKLGHVRGVIMQLCGKFDAEVLEMPTRSVKKMITGNGGAMKEHVQMMVKNLLELDNKMISLDASDALAVAICVARKLEIRETFRGAEGVFR